MKAMIFAAGLGTRLKPITDFIPKALVEVNGEPILGYQIKRLAGFGFTSIVVNVHHHAEKVKAFLTSFKIPGVEVLISDESDLLLDTGGGLWNAANLLNGDEPFLVHNVDILSNINLLEVYQRHIQSDSLASLVVSNRDCSRRFLFNGEGILRGWENTKTGEHKLPCEEKENLIPSAFSGIHVVDPSIFRLHQQHGAFSIVDVYLSLCAKYTIRAINPTNSTILDIGTPQKLQQANTMISEGVL